ncbi:TVP38/TMEM64 family inner membrane protein YdjZ [Candidatus Phycosocius bacilliformis]|uniref:TVP38/TMEM64 family inner membrane protein YdjZ n=1 Tax=Candidatus Phycosocius bacilliformis TaxID=1445552 RepID=A0A2P2EE19_9PROT|nr:VTT domain-containing protein [Candidatus Phycosocius bacilliformis]GBF59296.1 TVP38/TMEM64 family inner membrane protein YdjZ [Candidatus Phycosocius bacilliformis]
MKSLQRFGPLILIGLGLITAISMGWHKYLSFDVLAQQSAYLHDLVLTRPLVVIGAYVGIYILATTIALPGAIWITIAGGFLFGPLFGPVFGPIMATALASTSATIGATFLFMATQSALGGGLRARAGGLIDRLEKGFQENAFGYLLTLRLLPVAPFFGINLAAGFLGVPLRTFVLATAIGILPGCYVYASLGNGIEHLISQGQTPNLKIIYNPEVLGPLVGLALLALLPTAWKFIQARRKAA